MNVLIAPDKFKGSLTAQQVCDAVELAFKEVHPTYSITKIPMADGGEGTAEILTSSAKGKVVKVKARDPLFREIESWYGVSSDGKTAFIEMAAASGLQLLKAEERNPRLTSSIGTGDLILNAIEHNVEKIIVGCGGSATNDAGIGMAATLGVSFLDEHENELKPIGENLLKVKSINTKGLVKEIQNCSITFIADVANPLYGESGAAFTFASQKGASKEDVTLLDNGLRNFAEVVERNFPDATTFAGSGAAGGLPVSANAFLNATHERGIDFIMRWLNIEEKIRHADLVITGEGKFDLQSLNGKVVSGIAEVCKKYQKKLWVICGECEISEPTWEKLGIERVISLSSKILDRNKSISLASGLLHQLMSEVISSL